MHTAFFLGLLDKLDTSLAMKECLDVADGQFVALTEEPNTVFCINIPLTQKFFFLSPNCHCLKIPSLPAPIRQTESLCESFCICFCYHKYFRPSNNYSFIYLFIYVCICHCVPVEIRGKLIGLCFSHFTPRVLNTELTSPGLGADP